MYQCVGSIGPFFISMSVDFLLILPIFEKESSAKQITNCMFCEMEMGCFIGMKHKFLV